MDKTIIKDLKTDSDTPLTDHSFTVEKLVNNEDIRKKVVFRNQKQAKAYAILETIAERHNNIFIKRVIAKQLEYNISVEGKGREDIVKVSIFPKEKENKWIDKVLNMAGNKQ